MERSVFQRWKNHGILLFKGLFDRFFTENEKYVIFYAYDLKQIWKFWMSDFKSRIIKSENDADTVKLNFTRIVKAHEYHSDIKTTSGRCIKLCLTKVDELIFLTR
jgi:hypothetical protein